MSNNKGKRAFVSDVKLTPRINAHLSRRNLRFEYGGKYYQIESKTNASLTEYLSDLPRASLSASYVQRAISDQARSSVLDPLSEMMSGFDTRQKAAFYYDSFSKLSLTKPILRITVTKNIISQRRA